MPLPKGYTLDQPVKLPPGYTLDQPGAQTAAPAEQKGFASSFADSSGLSFFTPGHIIENIKGIPGAVVQMGKDTVANVQQGVADYRKEGLTQQTRRDFGRAVPVLGPALAQAQAQHDAGNNAGMAGTLAGTVAGFAAPEAAGEAVGFVKPRVGGVLKSAGEVAQEQAGGIINRTAGTLKSDFKRGANPGRGYLAEGNGVSSSMRSIADKAADARDAVGQRIGDAYAADTASGKLYPVQDVAAKVLAPLDKEIARSGRAGGRQATTTQLQELKDSIQPVLDKGAQQGGLSASDIFDLKRDLAENTPSWSEGTASKLSSVMQQQVGSLSGYLQEAIPDLAKANQSYMDLMKLASRAEERANTGSRPLTAHIKDVSTLAGAAGLGLGAAGGHAELGAVGGYLAGKALRSPLVRTAGATGLYRAGEGLINAGDKLDSALGVQPANAAIGNPIQGQAATSASNVSTGPRRLVPMITPIPGETMQDYLKRKKSAQR